MWDLIVRGREPIADFGLRIFPIADFGLNSEIEIPACKTPNYKHPARKMAGKLVTNKSQVPIFNAQNVWYFEFWSL